MAAYWPEFAAGGKDRITVRQVLSHQAGLPAIDRKLEYQDAATIAEASQPASEGPDAVLFTPTRFGLGFGLSDSAAPLLGPSSFRHSGMGGTLSFADADHRVGFAYVTNKLGAGSSIDPRAGRLIDTLRGCLK